MKKVAVVQSNYIPWKGYFDLIATVDEFILFDDMQYTRRDWRNRNMIKTSQGLRWLTVPVSVKGKYVQKIRDTQINDSGWSVVHWKSLVRNYGSTPHFSLIAKWLEPLYLNESFTHISSLNRRFIEEICSFLSISTQLTNSWEYTLNGDKTERLVDLCVQAGATEYISGPSAKKYINEKLFTDKKIKLTFFDYAHYPEYTQPWGAFVHSVTILDLLFNCGKDAPQYMKQVKSGS